MMFGFDLLSYCVYAAFGLLLLYIIWFALIADADLTLLFWEKFGEKPNYSGKVIWITGASSGIGEFLAYELASQGAKLVISGVSSVKLENVKANCLSNNERLEDTDILTLPFLIEDYAIHARCVQQVLQHFGHIDILVNNAGYSQRAKFEEIDIDIDLKLFSVNVFGAVNLTRKVLPHFLERKSGQVVVTSSLAGKLGVPYSCSYTGSKHALQGYFESLRSETIHSNISVCVACPGPVFSSLTSRCATGRVGELFSEEQRPTDKRMKTQRCSKLMVVAMFNKLDECWICLQPLLILYYLAQYTPTILKRFLLKVFFNPSLVQTLRRGR